ncbi:hypothetical protein [Staphylococcus casei]|uniref:Uncharacterized protein n=1 Tax=Staphylococcus casei TaxID=201828 RepID=A0ABZ2WA02_9STAP
MVDWIIFIVLILGMLFGLLWMFVSIWEMVEASKRKTKTEKQRKADEEELSKGCGCGCMLFIAFGFTAIIMGGVLGLWLK